MRSFLLVLLLVTSQLLSAQQFTFNRFSTDDGSGLSSNVVSDVFQDEKGFIWVGTANGLHRFDGRKFIQFNRVKAGSDPMPDARIYQVIPLDSGRIFLAFTALQEFGIFETSSFTYHRVRLQTKQALPPRSGFHAWKDGAGKLYLNVTPYGILSYQPATHRFIDDTPFPLPRGWRANLKGLYDDTLNQRVWICADSGLCVYDRRTRQTWTRYSNPLSLALLLNPLVQDNPALLHIDKRRRTWIFACPKAAPGSQSVYCLDSTGRHLLTGDTTGLLTGTVGETSFEDIYETQQGNLWMYGKGALFDYSFSMRRFQFHKSGLGNDSYNVSYEQVYRVIEDRDGGVWLATDHGLYFTSLGSNAYAVVNVMFDNKLQSTSLSDILEMPNGDFWFSTWGNGVRSMDAQFQKTTHHIYDEPPPGAWSVQEKKATRNISSLCMQSATGLVWVGCSEGILLVHDPVKHATRYLKAPLFGTAATTYIAEDQLGTLWFGTDDGKLIRYRDEGFEMVLNTGTAIYKVFPDKQNWLWVSTLEKGLYAIDPGSGKLLQHYENTPMTHPLYSNTGGDIEQLNDSVIVLAAGALHFVNKIAGTVRQVTYANGLPSNTVARLRMDENGFLWIITANGLCRYNPVNGRIMPYGKKDGIVFGEKTSVADLRVKGGYLVFAGSNAVLMFHPAVYAVNLPPPPVTITDFKIFNEFQPIDSLLQRGVIKLGYNQHSFSIFFASLSYIQRDRLTYYYKLEGVDKDWVIADRSGFVNYSLLPPGDYIFSIYCENIEGQRSKSVSQMRIHIQYPFWQTKWFMSVMIFLVALVIYYIHDMRVRRLMAVEQLRTRVARDLHDDMGSTLSTINILSAMAKSKMNNDLVKTTEYITKITDNSQRMMDAMDDIVWSIKPSNDSMQKVVARMREFATNVLEPKDIELTFEAADAVYDIKLDMEARRDLFLVFKEAVNNVAKYSKATAVLVSIAVAQKQLTLRVEDDGIGFDVATADNGNGLGNMQKRADAMKGSLRIHSVHEEGTRVEIVIPVS